ncbi:MAG: dTMP kinase [Chloroflexi bacterium]|nr:dTMP kinase [Chloroflexota bacterium]MDA1298035.1 dTMP kinase [Chloroflexota bacterium]
MSSNNRRGRAGSQRRVAASQADLPVQSVSPRTIAKKSIRLIKGLLITFEGGEGTGKTTQAGRLAKHLETLALDVHIAREPGATRLGEQIRTWVKRESVTSVTAETMLFAAARAQLVDEFLKPALSRGSVVILDRFIDSTVAYQGYGRGMSVEEIQTINRIATGGLIPDLTVFLDADPETALGRVEVTPSLFGGSGAGLAGRRVDKEDERRFEREPVSFHQKVRQGYTELAKVGGRWSVIRADQAPHRVADAIWKRVRPLLIDRGVDAELLVHKPGARSG